MNDEPSCESCFNNPGWITYYRTADGRKTTKDDPYGYFTASPCPDCDLGKHILANIQEKYGKAKENT